MPTAFRSRVYLPGFRVAATVLVDGFVARTWTTELAKRDGPATLVIAPFEALSKSSPAALTEEGERLARFVEPDATTFAIRFAE
jgi:hypothetical protein